jgi:hypothetical protein
MMEFWHFYMSGFWIWAGITWGACAFTSVLLEGAAAVITAIRRRK